MPTLTDHLLGPRDLGRLSEIEGLVPGHPRMGFLEKRLAMIEDRPEDFAACGVEDGGRIQAYACAHIQDGEFGNTGPVAVLDVIGVAPGQRGRGFGRRVLAELLDQLAARRIESLKTHVSWANQEMVRFFAAAGFSLAPVQIIERDASSFAEGDVEPREEGVRVRSLLAGDLDQVVRIDRKLTGRDRSAYYTAKFQELVAGSGLRISLVSEEDGVPTGFIMARVDLGGFGRVGGVAVLDSIGVHPAYRGTGIAKALLAQLLRNLSVLRVESVQTEVSLEDFELHRFLHACGFRQSQQLVLRAPVKETAKALAQAEGPGKP